MEADPTSPIPAATIVPPIHERGAWRQFWIGLGLMLLWPFVMAIIQPLETPADYLIYVTGFFWDLFWDPIRAAQNYLDGFWASTFTFVILALLVLMWITVAALPLLGRWRGRQSIGLWSLQCAYAGCQAIAGYFYANGLP